jgi:hypothetical protein
MIVVEEIILGMDQKIKVKYKINFFAIYRFKINK